MKKELNKNCKSILKSDYKLSSQNKVLIIFDCNSSLSQKLKTSYTLAAKDLESEVMSLDYDKQDPEKLKEFIFDTYVKDDIVVLIQSTSFRASKFRWRNELCSKGLKVVEHGHLLKVLPEEEETFTNSLRYDFEHYKKVSDLLFEKIKTSKETKIISSNGSIVKYTGELDKAIKNIGDFEGLTNYGSRYPIGEVITEGLDLSSLSGEIEVYAYPNLDQETSFVEPFVCRIEKGFLISHNGPKEFEKLVEMIKTEHPEGRVYVRELGLGLNRGIPRFSRLGDPIAYERQEGVHFSLGMKHGIYEKKLWPVYGKKFYQRYHIDVYVNVQEIYFDDVKVFEYGKGYLV